MARRRKLEAPSAADMDKLEQEFRRETPLRGAMAPIAQVAADAAGQTPVLDSATREQAARDSADAETYRDAQGRGLVMVEVPLEQIDLDDMIRDRVALDEGEMEELRLSIAANGLRLPVELYQLSNSDGVVQYGVVSGYRRIIATRGLLAASGDVKYSQIKALIKPLETVPDAFVAMVEENEIRAALSHFERGRIAVIATQNGAFASVEDAVNRLFASASKAKRSKVRSFAQVFEELGDMLAFPDGLTEKQGLRLAGALRMGGETQLREALADGQCDSAPTEWSILEPVIEEFETAPRDRSRGGRPRSQSPSTSAGPTVRHTSTGFVLRREVDERGYSIRFEGRAVDVEMVDAAMAELERLLERP